MTYYVYGYSDPQSPDPYFYIGKGLADRIYMHLKPALRLRINTHFYHKLNQILESGYEPEISILDEFEDELKALESEVALIQLYGRLDQGTGCLCNHTDGGEGISGYSHTKESRAKMSIETVGRVGWNKGISTGPEDFEICLKKSLAHSNLSTEMKEKIRQGQIATMGRPVCAINPATGKIVMVFTHIGEAARKGYKSSCISNVLAGRRRLAYGFIWKDYKVET